MDKNYDAILEHIDSLNSIADKLHEISKMRPGIDGTDDSDIVDETEIELSKDTEDQVEDTDLPDGPMG